MSAAARIGLLLLGLLALAGALHAPLHEDGGACSPAGLCSSAGILLGAVLGTAAWALILQMVPAPRLLAARAPRDHRPRLTVRGRAPPQG